jgi:hypothetical protein
MVLGKTKESVASMFKQFVDRQLAIINNPNLSPMQKQQAKKILVQAIDEIDAIIAAYNGKQGVKT